MKIGIYSELFGGSALGGREYIVAVLGEMFAQDGHSTEYLHHLPDLTAEQFSSHFGINSSCVRLRYVATRPAATVRHFFRSRALRAQWNRSLSESYDLFINIVHGPPVQCFAKRGILMVLFPFFEPFNVKSGSIIEGKSQAWVIARHLYHRALWKGWMDSYQLKTAISEYSREWTQRRWGVDSTVIFPPTDSSFTPALKLNKILSVGRFNGFRVAGLSKRQVELMRSFIELIGGTAGDWDYHSIGGVGSWPQDQAYFEEVAELATSAAGRAHVAKNAPRDIVKELYGCAKIFWHAAGYGDDDTKHPELMEHFGIATVDAMSAGCVPIVINKGAQPEIVQHGVNGFLWDTLDEMKSYTRQLMEDETLLQRMAQSAQARAQNFSREAFVRRFREFASPLMNGG